MNSIKTLNYELFIDLGGIDSVDLNFWSYNDSGDKLECPLFCAAAKGSIRFLKMLLRNDSLDLNIKDDFGVNAFWIACFFGHGDIMSELATKDIDVLCSNK